MTALAHAMFVTFQWRFAMMWIIIPGATLVPFAVVFFLGAPGLKWLRVGLIAALVGSFFIMLVMMTVGPTIVSGLIYSYGTPGIGVITAREQTAEMYNSQYVFQHTALLKGKSGGVTEATFKDSDFNIWPMSDTARYPSIGQHFATRYLPGYPDEFVIVTDGDSDFARSLICGALKDAVAAAQKGSDFAGNDATFRQRLANAQHAFEVGKCGMAARSVDRPSTAGDVATADPTSPRSAPSSGCTALIDALKAASQASAKSPHVLLLRRAYLEATQAVDRSGCTLRPAQ